MSEHHAPGSTDTTGGAVPGSGFRPTAVAAVPLGTIGESVGVVVPGASSSIPVTGISLNSRTVQPGDLYVALPGAARHGADFVSQAVAAGAVAVVTDDDGARLLALSADTPVPVLVVDGPRSAVGGLAALIYQSRPEGGTSPSLFGVTGTNGKTTTTYFINALLQALGRRTGLIGTIEILAGGAPIPSLLTTPESTDLHALLALMRERGLDAASMEVSSHAVSFHRVDGVQFDVAGFTNLTQDHLDLHGTMDEYFQTKARLFTPRHAKSAVITVDDEWGRRLASAAEIPVTTLATAQANDPAAPAADWTVTAAAPGALARSSGCGTGTAANCVYTRGCREASMFPTPPSRPLWSWPAASSRPRCRLPWTRLIRSPLPFRDACSSSPLRRPPSSTSPTTRMPCSVRWRLCAQPNPVRG